MSKTITTKTEVFTFSELSETAKEAAITAERETAEYPWGDDNTASLKAFCHVFGILEKGLDYSYGGNNDFIDFKTPTIDYHYGEEIEAFTGIRLLKYIYNNYYSELVTGKYYLMTSKASTPGNFKYKHRNSKIIMQWDNCTFTGYWIDNELLQPIFDFLAKPCKHTTIEDLLQNCLNSWLSACTKDYEGIFSEEYIIENFAASGVEFTEDGKQFIG